MKARALRRVYLREATITLAIARVAVHLFPTARVFAWASRSPRHTDRFAGQEIERVAWAVETIGAKRWMNAAPLPRSLAAQAMLRRRGIASRLCLGVARQRGVLALHAWVEVGQDAIIGGDQVAMFRRVAEFGAARQ